MAKNKSTKKNIRKTTTQKKGLAQKSIMSFLAIPILVILIAICLVGYFVIEIQVAPANSRHQQTLIETVANQYEAYTNAVLKQQGSLIDHIAASPALIRQVNDKNRSKLAETETMLADQIPYVLSVHIFPIRSAEMRPDANPPLSHAGLDMIRRAEQGQNLGTEAHQHDGQAYLNTVKAIRNDAGSLIGTVTVTQSLEYLSEALASIKPENGNLLIQQRLDGVPTQTLITHGLKSNNPIISMSSVNPNWTLSFQPSDRLSLSTVVSTNNLWAAFGALALVTLLPIILYGQYLQVTLRRDANAFSQQLQAAFTGQKAINTTYKLPIFNTLAQSINRIRMSKPSSTVKAPTNTPDADLDVGLAQAPIADEIDVDVSMMESDNDLLGMTQPAMPKPEPVQSPKSSPVDPAIFRTHDILGVYGQSLTLAVATQIGLAIGTEVSERGERAVIVGRDGRLSSPELAQALINGIAESGCDVIDVGMVPTPVCYFACEHLQVSSCVAVTGSHAASDYNGFKIVIAGNALLDDEIKAIHQRIENQSFLSGSGRGSISHQDVSNAYLTRISKDVKVKRPLKVVVDCGNGVAGNLVPQLIKGIGCHVLSLYCDVDGHFPNHAPNPSDNKDMQDLVRTVAETRADIGLAFDGDGNRLGLVVYGGHTISPDRLLMLLAKHVLLSAPGATVIYDVDNSRRLKNLINGFGGKPVMCRTGHAFIKRKMKETGAALAGDMSGHIYFKERWYGFDDALYTATRLLETISNQNETADVLFDELPQDETTQILEIPTPAERKYSIIESLQRDANFGTGQIVDLEGVRVEFPDGWGLVRASHSKPHLVCRFEAENQLALHKIQTMFKEQLLAVDSQLQIPF